MLTFRHLDAPAHFYSMRCALLTSMEKTVSKWTLHGTSRPSEPQRELESEWDPGLLRAYIAWLFLTARPSLITVSPLVHSGSTFGSVSCSRAARFKQNQRMIALSLCKPPPPPLEKEEEGVGGARNVLQTRLARAVDVTFKELALVLLQFQKTSNRVKKKKKMAAWIRGTPPPPEET